MASAGFYKHFGSRPEIGAPRTAGPRKRFARPGRRIENPLTLIIEEPRGAPPIGFVPEKSLTASNILLDSNLPVQSQKCGFSDVCGNPPARGRRESMSQFRGADEKTGRKQLRPVSLSF